MKAPEQFLLYENTGQVLSYFNECETQLIARKAIFIDVANITAMDTAAFTLLVSRAVSLKYTGKIRGNTPFLPEIRDIFLKSGFYDYVTLTRGKSPKADAVHHMLRYAVDIETSTITEVAAKAMDHAFGKESARKLAQPLYTTLLEIVSNTKSHATKGESSIKWWIYMYCEEETRTAHITIFDLGIGIFESVRPKWKKRVVKPLLGDEWVAKELIEGKMPSRVKEDGEIRGKGIPQIVENLQAGTFGRAYLISNNIKVNLKTKEIEKLQSPLHGTLYHFQLQYHKK